MADGWPVPTIVVTGETEKYDAMAASNAALAASGTVALELALAGVPAVIAYRGSSLTAFLARLLIKVSYAHLVNLILDRGVIPEFLQNDCRPDALAEQIRRLLGPEGARQIEAVQPALAVLGREGLPPSARAAKTILDIIAERRKARE
jgi:lipid-A-disaccharide synthase